MEEGFHRVPFDSWKVNLLGLPLAFLFVFLSKLLVLPGMILWYFCTIPMHEMGHAVAAWLGGRFALPLGALIPMVGFTTVASERSALVYFLLMGGLGYLGLRSWVKRFLFPAGVCAFLMIAATVLTWLLPDETTMMFVIYGGGGGEFLLGTFLVISFYYRMSERWRWDFFRIPALLMGSFAFASAFSLWRKISQGAAGLPIGSFMNGSGDAGGDIDRLMTAYGWTRPELISHFTGLGKFCLWIIIAHYLFFLMRAYLKSKA